MIYTWRSIRKYTILLYEVKEEFVNVPFITSRVIICAITSCHRTMSHGWLNIQIYHIKWYMLILLTDSHAWSSRHFYLLSYVISCPTFVLRTDSHAWSLKTFLLVSCVISCILRYENWFSYVIVTRFLVVSTCHIMHCIRCVIFLYHASFHAHSWISTHMPSCLRISIEWIYSHMWVHCFRC